MDYRIVYELDGVAQFICPAPGAPVEKAAAAVPEGVPYRVIDVADIPTDRTLRDAWAADFSVDEAKAEAIMAEKRRQQIPLELAEIYKGMPSAQRAQFAPLMAGVESLFKLGDTEAVQQLIMGTPVPAELQSLKDQMLAKFEGAKP